MAMPKLLLLRFTICLVLLSNTEPVWCKCFYKAIFSFGDSLADTGNFLRLEANNSSFVSQFPYGMTYFHRPTGRCSNGRLIVDFIAQSLGLPLLPPYLASGQNFEQGVNFAVVGATALDVGFFEERGMYNPYTNISLAIQLSQFKDLLPSLCNSSSNCHNLFSTSLFLLGEIGGNDYNHPFEQGKSLEEIRTFVPKVVSAISSALQVLIDHGAMTIVVPGNFPIGCISLYLTMFQSSNQEDYNPITGCLNWLNEFAIYHNQLLLKELARMRYLHPHATIIYADYYNAAMAFFSDPLQFGFRKGVLRACCGSGGPYNYNSVHCGYPGSEVCDDPSMYVNWDGFHFTEAAYKAVAIGLLKGEYAIPPIDISSLILSPMQKVTHPYYK